MHPKELLNHTLHDLDNLKALNIRPIDVRQLTPLTDYMVIATGNSSRHVRAIADNLIMHMKKRAESPHISVEGDDDDEWLLVDLGDVIVHIMQQQTRDFYNLEKLWTNVYDDTGVSEDKVALA